MKRVLNFRVVEGDPNEVDKNEILLRLRALEREGAMGL